MASSKPKLTDEQILQYILVGGDLENLSKNTSVSQQQLLRVLVTNPQVLQAFQKQAQADTVGLDAYNPQSWYADTTPKVNYIQEQYNQMEPAAAKYATDYFTDYKLAGGNPIRLAELEKIYNDPALVEQRYKIPQQAYATLFEKIKEDAPKWFSQQLEVERDWQDTNYKAFQSRRKEANILAGETAAGAIMRQTTGFGELANLPSPETTFAKVAMKRAEQKYASPEIKPNLKGKSVSSADRAVTEFLQSPSYKKQTEETDVKRAMYQRGFLKAAAEKAGKKGTPYTETVKKILPFIAARLNVEG